MNQAITVRWAFLASDDANVQCPIALTNGVARIVGKRYDAETSAYAATGEPHAYAMSKRDAAGLRAFFAKAIRQGHLAPADAATAAAFGVPFTSSTTPTGADHG